MKKIITLSFLNVFAFAALFTQPVKYVLVEEGTGTWCQWCPRGDVFATQLGQQYQNVFFVAVHNGDDMTDNEYDAYMSGSLSGYPSGHVDRTINDIDPLNWESPILTQLGQGPVAGITVTTDFDETTRDLSMTVSAAFVENLNGDYRLAAIVVEDGVTGPAPDYDQSNAYSGGSNGPMGGYEELPNPVPAAIMVYNHVGRYLAGGLNGAAGSLPETISNMETHSYTYTYTLPEEYNEEYIQVIGLLINADNGQILNAGKSTYLPGFTNAKPFFHSDPKEKGFSGLNYTYDILCHDPEHDELTIFDGGNLPAWLSLTDLGDGEAVLSGTPPALGTYQIVLTVSDGEWEIDQAFDLTIEEPTEDWIPLGSEGFSNNTCAYSDIEIGSQGIPFLMNASSDNDQINVFKFENNSWEMVAPPITGANAFHAGFDIGPDDVPYVITEDQIYKLDGGNWVSLGGTIGGDIYSDIIITGDGTPFAVAFAPPNTTNAYRYNGTGWDNLGAVTDGIAVWNRFNIDNNGNPVLIYGTDGNNIAYSEVAQWDGSQWNLLGGGYIEPNAQTYFDHDVAVGPNGATYACLTIGLGEQFLHVYQLVNGSWLKIGDNIAGGATEGCTIEVDNDGFPIVAFRDEATGGRTSVMRFDGSGWIYMGQPGFTNIAGRHALATDENGIPYVSYRDESAGQKASVKKYENLAIGTRTPRLADLQLGIYPNPNHGSFILEHKNGTRYQMYNLQGKLIQSGMLNNFAGAGNKSVERIQAKALIPGLYILKVTGEAGIQTAKFIIEK